MLIGGRHKLFYIFIPICLAPFLMGLLADYLHSPHKTILVLGTLTLALASILAIYHLNKSSR